VLRLISYSTRSTPTREATWKVRGRKSWKIRAHFEQAFFNDSKMDARILLFVRRRVTGIRETRFEQSESI